MIKVNKKIIISIALIFCILNIFITNQVLANAIENIDFYNPQQKISTNGSFFTKISKVLGWIRLVGIAVALLAITIIGTKYIFISVDEKAEYKKAMVPYLIGFFMLLCTSIVIGIIAQIAEG